MDMCITVGWWWLECHGDVYAVHRNPNERGRSENLSEKMGKTLLKYKDAKFTKFPQRSSKVCGSVKMRCYQIPK